MTQLLENVMLQNFIAALFGGAVTYGLSYLAPKTKLVVWFPHSFSYKVSKDISIHTQSYAIQNLGRALAEKIEIVHTRRPDFFQLYPALNYAQYDMPGGEHVVAIESLAPKEFFSLEILSHSALPELEYIRHRQGTAQTVTFSLQREVPRWKSVMLKALLLLGFITLIYSLWELISQTLAAMA